MGRKAVSSPPRSVRVRFFKIMLGDFQHQIRIPPAFTEHVNGEVKEVAKLRGPTGKAWSVEVKRAGNNMFFKRGWQDFVEYHRVQNGEFLVFRYDGNMIFDVKIFGVSACQKDRATFIRNHPSSRQTVSCRRCDEQIKATRTDNGKYNKHFEENSEELSIVGKSGLSNMKPLPRDEDISRGLPATNAFKPMHPYFMASMKPSHLQSKSGRFTIPRRFMKENGITGRSSMKLRDHSGRLQTLTILNKQSDGRFEFGSGWRDFCVANYLKKGDVCIFELLPGLRELDVHIFRTVETVEMLPGLN